MTYGDLHDIAERGDRAITAAIEWIRDETPTIAAVLAILALLGIGAGGW